MTELLAALCSIPTAPFVEDRVYGFIESFAKRQRFTIQRDRFGNRLVQTGPSRGARLVFVAHTDHPGLVAERMIDRRTLVARFHGGVLNEYVSGAKVRFFAGRREIRGAVAEITRESDRGNTPAEVLVRLAPGQHDGPVPPSSPGMFDVGAARIRGGRFFSRVCDDLAGVAAILAAMSQLDRRTLKAPVAALLTRGEEEGFIGAIAAVKDRSLLRRDDRVVSVECSAVQPYARLGDGVILRVGDRTSVFDSAFTHWMHRQCERLAETDGSFKYQRALMPGGSCEGTVFDAHGYTAGAVCVPLGNYHNMDRENKRIGPEYIDLNDYRSEVKLFAHLMRHAHEVDLTFKPLKQRLNKRFSMMKKYL